MKSALITFRISCTENIVVHLQCKNSRLVYKSGLNFISLNNINPLSSLETGKEILWNYCLGKDTHFLYSPCSLFFSSDTKMWMFFTLKIFKMMCKCHECDNLALTNLTKCTILISAMESKIKNKTEQISISFCWFFSGGAWRDSFVLAVLLPAHGKTTLTKGRRRRHKHEKLLAFPSWKCYFNPS